MSRPRATGLLAPDEPPAAQWLREDSASNLVLVCDHASRLLPRALGTLGLSDHELESHIAWDIGAAGVATRLSERLEASLLMQTYSRLAIDCNRPPDAADSVTSRSEWGEVPGNVGLSDAQRQTRRHAIFDPYHAALGELLGRRREARRPTLLVALHSFTPSFRGVARPWHIGLMHRGDALTAKALLALLRRDERLVVGDNQPYPIEDDSDYTLPMHGEQRGIAHIGIEIRQDLIADETGQKTWAGRLASLLRQLDA